MIQPRISPKVNTLTFPIQNNKLNGPAMLFMANGDRLEISYENGVVHGNATIKGRNYGTISYFLIMIEL